MTNSLLYQRVVAVAANTITTITANNTAAATASARTTTCIVPKRRQHRIPSSLLLASCPLASKKRRNHNLDLAHGMKYLHSQCEYSSSTVVVVAAAASHIPAAVATTTTTTASPLLRRSRHVALPPFPKQTLFFKEFSSTSTGQSTMVMTHQQQQQQQQQEEQQQTNEQQEQQTNDSYPATTVQNKLTLQSVKQDGLKILQSLTSDIQSKTKRRLLLSDEDTGPTPDQLREASRLKQFMEDAIEQFTSKRGNLFCVMNEPIVVVDVEITQDLRQARVFWSLPYGVMLMDGISAEARMRVSERMQRVLEEKGGVLQGLVHQKMRGYFRPPKIRFVMAEGEMLRNYLRELL